MFVTRTDEGCPCHLGWVLLMVLCDRWVFQHLSRKNKSPHLGRSHHRLCAGCLVLTFCAGPVAPQFGARWMQLLGVWSGWEPSRIHSCLQPDHKEGHHQTCLEPGTKLCGAIHVNTFDSRPCVHPHHELCEAIHVHTFDARPCEQLFPTPTKDCRSLYT